MVGKRKAEEKIVDWNINAHTDGHQTRKSKRIRAIARVLKSKGRVDYERFLAEMQFNGIRKAVAEGYLQVLKDLGLISYVRGSIVWKGQPLMSKTTEIMAENTDA